MKLPAHWLWTLVILIVVWAGVGVVMKATDDLVSTPEKVAALIEEAPWYAKKSLGNGERAVYLGRVIKHQNQLDFKQRRDLREDNKASIETFFASLTPEEQKAYVDQTTESHLKAVTRSLKVMPANERKQMAGRIRRDMIARNGENGEKVPALGDLELMLDVGLDTFLKDAPPAEKLRLAPMIEDMQARIQTPR